MISFNRQNVNNYTLAPTEIVPAIAKLPNTVDAANQLPQIVEQSYQWFDERNKQQALLHLQGALIACQLGLTKQIPLYKEKLIDITTFDMVARTSTLVSQQKAFQGVVYLHPGAGPLPSASFNATFALPGEYSQSWAVRPIEKFAQLIPPQALQAIVLLDKAGIVPDGFWVAKQTRSIDPILFACFYRRLVAVAQWV